MREPEVRVVAWVKASEVERRTGLCGYLRVAYGALELDGIVLRRTSGGRYSLSFPARTDRAGRRHSYVRPADDHARREIEREIFRQLGQRERERTGVEDLP